jgi:prepilin-type N-terminal cleavage/methylation domain-containing protein
MPRDEEGFTLVELLIAMLIMLVIIVPLVGSFVLGIQTGLGSQQDVTDSADAQLVGYYFDADVASAETVSPTSSTCGGPGSILQLTWTDGGAVQVAYRAVADTTRQAELHLTTPIYRLERVRCSNATTDVTVLGRTVTAVPAAQCDAATCTPSTTTPRRVSLAIPERSTQQADKGSTDTFTVAVSATRRVTP